MKIAVYTIALNEEKFVQRWYDSAKEADYLLIADTGSTDNTARLAQRLGINVVSVSVSPWRFDDARNASLALLPKDIDYCIALDMDEVLVDGWREQLEKAHANKVTRPTYRFITDWDAQGNPSMEFEGFRIHARHGYRWKYPIHEVPEAYGITETREFVGLEIHHLPDNDKSRGQYLPLLKMAVEEDPHGSRAAFYYGRELFFHGQLAEAAEQFSRYLTLPSAVWKAERANTLRYLAKCEPNNAVSHLKRAVSEDPKRREPRVDLMMQYYGIGYWNGLFANAKIVLEELTEKPLDYFAEGFAWGALPYDLGALGAHHMGDKERAIAWGTKALELDPTNERLERNLEFYQAD
jgi:glycosyltransferase involved in cell wall biosynthesis